MNRPISSQGIAAESSAAQDTSHSCPIDRKTLDGIRALQNQGASNLLNELIEIYLNDSPKLLEGLQEAIIRADATALQEAAHSLKSISANMGALTLRALCEELETMGRKKLMEGIAEVLSKVSKEYEKVVIALKLESEKEQNVRV
jgi:HPt (histidine-containing phosphotransfer) domain-containing protein